MKSGSSSSTDLANAAWVLGAVLELVRKNRCRQTEITNAGNAYYDDYQERAGLTCEIRTHAIYLLPKLGFARKEKSEKGITMYVVSQHSFDIVDRLKQQGEKEVISDLAKMCHGMDRRKASNEQKTNMTIDPNDPIPLVSCREVEQIKKILLNQNVKFSKQVGRRMMEETIAKHKLEDKCADFVAKKLVFAIIQSPEFEACTASGSYKPGSFLSTLECARRRGTIARKCQIMDNAIRRFVKEYFGLYSRMETDRVLLVDKKPEPTGATKNLTVSINGRKVTAPKETILQLLEA
jgi:hypothetical protein